MTDKAELPADDDTGSRVSEHVLIENADAAVSAPAVVSADEGGRVKDEDADLFWGTNAADRELFAASNKRELGLWHGLIVEKRTLQRAGFGVWFTDKRGTYTGKRGPWIAVGKAVVSHAEFRAMAARHRVQRAAA